MMYLRYYKTPRTPVTRRTPVIETQHEQEADSLFSPGKTNALAQGPAGMEDFELVSFLLIQSM